MRNDELLFNVEKIQSTMSRREALTEYGKIIMAHVNRKILINFMRHIFDMAQ